MIMQIVCKKCGSSELYLKKKGPQIGAYCNKCGAWIKWVSKKDQPAFTRKGFKIHEETYEPHLNIPSVNNSPIDNEPVPYDYQSYNGNQGFQSQACMTHQEDYDDAPFDYGSEADYPTGGYAEDTVEDTKDCGMKYCEVCSTGELPMLNPSSSSVQIRITDNVLIVTDKDTGEMLGMAKVNKCPCCGETLG